MRLIDFIRELGQTREHYGDIEVNWDFEIECVQPTDPDSDEDERYFVEFKPLVKSIKEKTVISQTLIDLMQLVKEQQELLTILLATLPESEHKAAMLASIERTAASTRRIDGNITAAIVEGAKAVKGDSK